MWAFFEVGLARFSHQNRSLAPLGRATETQKISAQGAKLQKARAKESVCVPSLALQACMCNVLVVPNSAGARDDSKVVH